MFTYIDCRTGVKRSLSSSSFLCECDNSYSNQAIVNDIKGLRATLIRLMTLFCWDHNTPAMHHWCITGVSLVYHRDSWSWRIL